VIPARAQLAGAAAKAAGPRLFGVDTVQRGLALRVEPTGYMAYKVVYRHHKKQLRSAT